MAAQDPAQAPPSLADIAAAIIAQALDPAHVTPLHNLARNNHIESWKDANELAWKAAAVMAGKLAEGLVVALNQPDPVYDEIAKSAIDGLFGGGGGRAGRSKALADTAAAKIMASLASEGGSLEPSQAPAMRYLNTVTHLAIEGWIQGFLVEAASEVMPTTGGIETFGELDNTIAQVLGLGRLTRRVLGPLIDATVVKPSEWHTNKTYRPELLTAADAVRQALRGRWPRERAVEELARQGWSDDRIEALFNAQRKFFSVGDVRTFVDRQHWTNEHALQHLQDQGYDRETAQDGLRLEGLRRIDQLEAQEAAAIITAYVNREIDRATMRGLLNDAVTVASERALLEELAEVRRAVNVKGLSAAEARACTKAGILSVLDYRRALEREGYDDDAVLALELLLRQEMDIDAKIDALRAAALAERAAEQAAREAAAAARKAEVEQQRALARRGPVNKLERAVVRGLIPIGRLEEVLRAQYDADTVAIFVADVEQDRENYLTQEQAAADARRRAEVRAIGIADLEAAVLAGVLTIDDFSAGAAARGFPAGDVHILTATLRARKADRDAAIRTRAEAELVAKRRAIDLGRFETLVRRGVRTLAQYDALLVSLGFEDGARADMRELLELKIADDAAARALRDAVDLESPAKGLTLEQTRRAVVLGLLPFDAFETFLMQSGYTTDAQIVLLAELRDDVAQADAARARREQSEIPPGAAGMPLSTVRRAARLGFVSPDVYVDRLVAAGWSDEDIAIDVPLLLAEIADVQAARTAREMVPTPAGDEGLTLAQLAAAVKRGIKTLADYQARAHQLGLSSDAVTTQLRILADELEETKAAKARRDLLVGGLDAEKVPIAALEQAVRDGQFSLDAFAATLRQKGLAPDDADLLAALLADELGE